MIMGLPFCWDELILPDRGGPQRKIPRTPPLRMRWARDAGGAGSSAPIANLQGGQGEGRSGRSRHGASVKGAMWREAAAKVGAAEPQIRMVLGASCQKRASVCRLRMNARTMHMV